MSHLKETALGKTVTGRVHTVGKESKAGLELVGGVLSGHTCFLGVSGQEIKRDLCAP